MATILLIEWTLHDVKFTLRAATKINERNHSLILNFYKGLPFTSIQKLSGLGLINELHNLCEFLIF